MRLEDDALAPRFRAGDYLILRRRPDSDPEPGEHEASIVMPHKNDVTLVMPRACPGDMMAGGVRCQQQAPEVLVAVEYRTTHV